MACSKPEAYLINFDLPQEYSRGFRWSLLCMKFDTKEDSLDPYIAFDSHAAATEFITVRGNNCLSVIEMSELDLDTYFEIERGAIVFRSVAELDSRLSNPEAGAGQLRPFPVGDRFSNIVRTLKNWRMKQATKHLIPEN